MKKQRFDLTLDEVAANLTAQGVKVKKSYCHEDYRTLTLALPWDLYDKLTAMHTNVGLNRSKFIRLLVRNIDEEIFKKLIKGE